MPAAELLPHPGGPDAIPHSPLAGEGSLSPSLEGGAYGAGAVLSLSKGGRV